MKRTLLFALAVVASVATGLQADRVITSTGGVVEGTVSESGQYVYVDGPFGRVQLERKDVREIIRDSTTQPTPPAGTAPAAGSGMIAAPDASAFPQANRPEPIIFALMRRLIDVRPGAESASVREGIDRWRSLEHDGAIKVGTQWIDRAEITRRRDSYEKLRQEAEALLRTMKTRSPTAQEEQENSRIKLQAQAKLRTAAGNWPDPAIRSFLQGDLALQADNGILAQRMFTEAITLAPHVVGFYQGRALANLMLDRPMDALTDAMTAFRLKDDEAASFFALKDVMEKVPGGRTREPLYQQAEELIALYNEPANRPRETTNRGTRWVMPGGYWQGIANSLPTPPVDSFVTYRAVATPVNENGVMLTDGRLIEGAALMLLEVASGQYVNVTAARVTSSRQASAAVPVAAVQAHGVTFAPVALAEAALTAGQELTAYSHTAPLEMAAEALREVQVRVKDVPPDGTVVLDPPLLPGEAAAPLLNADGRLAGFLAGRTDVRSEMGGPNLFVGGADFAKNYEAAAKLRRSSAGSGYGRLTKKGEPPLIEGNVFTLYVIVGQGGPEKKP